MEQPISTRKTSILTDPFDRRLNYLRIAVTDRCNFRCTYCMPPQGLPDISHENIMRYEEILRVVRLLIPHGLKKIRITGGEPLVRKGLLPFLEELKKSGPHLSLHLTTNGALLADCFDQLQAIGLNGINLSLDTLDAQKFFQITRRDEFEKVWQGLELVLQSSIPLKLNMVVQRGVNEDEIVAMAELARRHAVEVRFIEQMPFNGHSGVVRRPVKAREILALLQQAFPEMYYLSANSLTAERFGVPGFEGTLGIIAGYSRTFCADCNRLRLTADGTLKTCLYDKGRVNLKDLMRAGYSDQQILSVIAGAVANRFRDGFAAEKENVSTHKHSMAQIGG